MTGIRRSGLWGGVVMTTTALALSVMFSPVNSRRHVSNRAVATNTNSARNLLKANRLLRLEKPSILLAKAQLQPTPTTIQTSEVVAFPDTSNFAEKAFSRPLPIGFVDIDLEQTFKANSSPKQLVQALPERIRKLDGERIVIQGYMDPNSTFFDKGITQFVLCRDTTHGLIPGREPRLSSMLRVRLRDGDSTNFVDRRSINVAGIFRIEPTFFKEGEQIHECYRIDDAQILKK